LDLSNLIPGTFDSNRSNVTNSANAASQAACIRQSPKSTEGRHVTINRGNKDGLSLLNADLPLNLAVINAPGNPGGGFLRRQGYTLVWLAGRRGAGQQPRPAQGVGGAQCRRHADHRNVRGEPDDQPLLCKLPYPRPHKLFKGLP